jgi:hypothetical protein
VTENNVFESVLKRICADVDLESEWLRMLSQLEYAGCRKIIKSVPFDKVDLSVLNHVMEEASHAYLLRAQAERLGGALPSAPLTEIAWTYFQTLDHGVSRLQGQGYHYPPVSWIIERRVLEVYPRYLETTRQLGVKRVLSRILAQEERHGAQFEALKLDEAFKIAAIEWEASLWSDFVLGLQSWAAPKGAMHHAAL